MTLASCGRAYYPALLIYYREKLLLVIFHCSFIKVS